MIVRACLAAVVLAIFLLCSCTVDTDLIIHDDASGSAAITIHLAPAAVSYMSDLMLSLGSESHQTFDIESIRRAFDERQGVELESIEQQGDDTLKLRASFDDIRLLLAGTSEADSGLGPPPIAFQSSEGHHKLSVVLNRENFGYISGLFVVPDSPLTVLLPYGPYDFMPKDEYLEILEYALEDYLDGVPADKFLADRRIAVSVTADRPVLDVTGGKLRSGRAVFDVPILDVLTLEEELWFGVSW